MHIFRRSLFSRNNGSQIQTLCADHSFIDSAPYLISYSMGRAIRHCSFTMLADSGILVNYL